MIRKTRNGFLTFCTTHDERVVRTSSIVTPQGLERRGYKLWGDPRELQHVQKYMFWFLPSNNI